MLSKSHRLRKKKDFERLAQQGCSIKGSFLVLRFSANNLTISRVGFVVSKKISKKAVVRNKTKRHLREVVRALIDQTKTGYDLIFFSRQGIEEKSFEEIKEMIISLLKKAGLLKEASQMNGFNPGHGGPV